MKQVTLNIRIGYETQSINLDLEEWKGVQSGEFLVKEVDGLYEGEVFTYSWHFNDPNYLDSSLVVLYGDADGFLGSINDAWQTQ